MQQAMHDVGGILDDVGMLIAHISTHGRAVPHRALQHCCSPQALPLKPAAGLGAPTQVSMRSDEQCKVLCRIESLSAAQAKAFVDKFQDDLNVHMCVRAGGAAVPRQGGQGQLCLKCPWQRCVGRRHSLQRSSSLGGGEVACQRAALLT